VRAAGGWSALGKLLGLHMPEFSSRSIVVTEIWVDWRVPVVKLGADLSATGSYADAAPTRHIIPCCTAQFLAKTVI